MGNHYWNFNRRDISTMSIPKEKPAGPVGTDAAGTNQERGNHSTNAGNGKADFGAHVR